MLNFTNQNTHMYIKKILIILINVEKFCEVS